MCTLKNRIFKKKIYKKFFLKYLFSNENFFTKKSLNFQVYKKTKLY